MRKILRIAILVAIINVAISQSADAYYWYNYASKSQNTGAQAQQNQAVPRNPTSNVGNYYPVPNNVNTNTQYYGNQQGNAAQHNQQPSNTVNPYYPYY